MSITSNHLIRDTKTGQFYANGPWVSGTASAKAFPDAASALAFCLQERVQDAEIVSALADESVSHGDKGRAGEIYVILRVNEFNPSAS